MKWWGWVIVALLVWWVFKDPGPAARAVHDLGGAVNNVFTFLNRVFAAPAPSPDTAWAGRCAAC